MLLAAGDGGDCDGLLGGICPAAYELGAGSPMVGNGADLTQFGIPLPLTGYYGTPFENAVGYNVGADSRLSATCATGRARACAALTATHDVNDDGRSDIVWRDTDGATPMATWRYG
jgi:hypothetical protein